MSVPVEGRSPLLHYALSHDMALQILTLVDTAGILYDFRPKPLLAQDGLTKVPELYAEIVGLEVFLEGPQC